MLFLISCQIKVSRAWLLHETYQIQGESRSAAAISFIT